jgi:hypothetical protein
MPPQAARGMLIDPDRACDERIIWVGHARWKEDQ